MGYKEVEGDLIKMAQDFEFDVIVHGINCFNSQDYGLSLKMAQAFHTTNYRLEAPLYKGEINKLGQIEYSTFHDKGKEIIVVNCYVQYAPPGKGILSNLNYHALKLCLHKINFKWRGLRIGLPIIGGVKRDLVKSLIKNNLSNCDVTVVNYDPWKITESALSCSDETAGMIPK